jgi:CubicO group peptidase (beta-lactamase class C family)
VETATLTHGRYPNSGEDGSETFHGYGYAMQPYAVRSERGVHHLFAAIGNGGQMAAVIPDVELVVASTGADYNDGGRAKRYLIRTLIELGILPTMS